MAEILVSVREADTDAGGTEQLSGLLREELLALDVEQVRPVTGGAAPPGSRGVDVAAVGALLVTLTPTVELLRAVIGTVSAWLGRSRAARTVELTVGETTLKLTSASQDQQDRLVEEFLRAAARA